MITKKTSEKSERDALKSYLILDKNDFKKSLTDRIDKGKSLELLNLSADEQAFSYGILHMPRITTDLNNRQQHCITEFRRWSEYNEELLKQSFDIPDNEYLRRYNSTGVTLVLTSESDLIGCYQKELNEKINYLISLVDRIPLLPQKNNITNNDKIKNLPPKSKRVFIVHGHDSELRNEVETLMMALNYEPVTLFKKPNLGDTIIEKIEREVNDIAFSVILYTPCDLGNDKNAVHKIADLNNRARQNVIFEHGYMCALLGRKNVCAIVEPNVEIPGDLSGIVYIERDNKGKWKFDVVREMKAAGLDIDVNKLFGVM